ncbi:MAG: AMP-binding protein, partial [bacterium]
YDTARIAPKFILKYLWQAIMNRPRDYAHLFRPMPFKEGKVGRRAALEWMPIHFHASAGTTGDPTPAVYTHYDITQVIPEVAAKFFAEPPVRDPEVPAVEWTDKTFSLFPGVPHLAFFETVIAKFVLGMSVFDSCGGNVIPTERQIEIFSEGEFNAAAGIPSYMVYWLRKAVEMRRAGRVREMPHFKGIAVGGEPVTGKLREHYKELARELGAHPRFTVIEALGMTEMKWAFSECFEETGIHLNPKFFFWEILDKDTKKPVPDGGEGVLVFSHIGWRGSSFVRYWTGDLICGGVRWERCSYCKKTFPILRGPVMRAAKDFTKIKGTRVSLLDLVSSVRDVEGVSSFQMFLEKENPDDEFSRDIIKVRVAAKAGVDEKQLEGRIRTSVKQTTEVTPDRIEFEKDDEKLKEALFAEGVGIKAKYIVENRPTHL